MLNTNNISFSEGNVPVGTKCTVKCVGEMYAALRFGREITCMDGGDEYGHEWDVIMKVNNIWKNIQNINFLVTKIVNEIMAQG